MANTNNGVLDGVRRIGAKIRELTIDGGLPGAPLGFRLRGATTAGHPATGMWKTGDETRDRNGIIWICTAGGSPGTWTQSGMLPAALWSPSAARYSNVVGNPRETFPYWGASGNQSVSGGVMYLALLPVAAGDVISNVGFVCGTTGATFGSSGYHWWTALYSNTATFIAQSADQTNTTIAFDTAYMLSLGTGAPYTVGSGITFLYAAVMINTGTGGSPTQPTIRGPSQVGPLVSGSTSLWPSANIASATNGSSLGATAPSGTISLTTSSNYMYMGAS
jgi:hypothetical protein